MADQITTNPNAARDWAGDIVPGARMFAYETGTTTLVTVFQDVDGTIPHPSPILADGQGVFPQIFFTGIVKIVVTDADGVILPGYPLDPAPRSIVGTSGASAISFLPTGAIPVTDVQAAIERVQQNAETALGTGQGILSRDNFGVINARFLTGTAGQVTVAVGGGVTGNPVISLVPATQALAVAGVDNISPMTALTTRQAFNATGTAPTFACRAWVNFNGTGTPAIRAAGNVSSITDNGPGDYTVNFAVAMPDANYAPVVTITTGGVTTTVGPEVAANVQAGSLRVLATQSGAGPVDPTMVSVAIFR